MRLTYLGIPRSKRRKEMLNQPHNDAYNQLSKRNKNRNKPNRRFVSDVEWEINGITYRKIVRDLRGIEILNQIIDDYTQDVNGILVPPEISQFRVITVADVTEYFNINDIGDAFDQLDQCDNKSSRIKTLLNFPIELQKIIKYIENRYIPIKEYNENLEEFDDEDENDIF